MFKGLLGHTLNRLDAVMDYYEWEMKMLEEYLSKELPKYQFSFLVDTLFHLLIKDKLSDEETKKKEQLYKKIEPYLYLPPEQPEKEQGVVRYRIINNEQLDEKGICTDIIAGAKQYRKLIDMPAMLSFNTLSLLVTRFEEFLADYLEELFQKFPSKYIDKQSIKFEDISKYECIDEVRAILIQQEVEKQMRQDYKSLIKLLESSHGMNFCNIEDKLHILYEISARRNIWVHNSGIVNSTYLGIVRNSNYSMNERATITHKYLSDTIQCIKIVTISIMLESVKLICKDDVEYYLSRILWAAFNALKNKNYELCIYTFGTLKALDKLPADKKIVSQVNYWIAYIGLHGLDSVKADISKWDVTAYDMMFQLAKDTLLENYEQAAKTLEYLYNSKRISENQITTWPLFETFRKSKEYEMFVQHHSCNFGVQTMAVNEETADSTECNLFEKKQINSEGCR